MIRVLATVVWMGIGAASVFGAQSDPVTLKSDRLAVVFDRARQGAVISLTDNATGVEFINGKAAEKLFAISWTRPGDKAGELQWLSSSDAKQVEWNVSQGKVSAVFSRLGGKDVTVTCTAVVAADGEQIHWNLRVTGNAPIVLEEFSFPVLSLRTPLEKDGGADAVVLGLTKGGIQHEPAKWGVGRGLSATQPGQLAAQFGCYYTTAAGFFSQTRDPQGYPKRLECMRTKDGLKWMWKRRCFHLLDKPFELGYEIATTTFAAQTASEPTDWRDAADIYKKWALTQPWCATPYIEREDVPRWMKSGPAMIRFSRGWLEKPERVEGWLNDYWEKHFPDVPLVVALWGWEQVGSWISPKYFPPYPSEEVFLRIVNTAKRIGGHAFPWPSGYYWNVEYEAREDGGFTWQDWDDFNATGLPHALRNRDGEPLVRKLSWLRGGRNVALCRGDKWTREWFDRTATKLMELGCDMVQVDQVVGGLAPGAGECFSSEHGHPPGPGLWDTAAFTQQLKSLNEKCRRIQPDAVLSIEEPQELFNHLIGIQDYRDGQSRRWPALPGLEHASVFGYLYHEFLPVFQSNPQSGDSQGLAYCAVTGQIPHWVPHWPVTPAPALANGEFEEWHEDVPAGWDRVKGWAGTEFRGRSFRDDVVKREGNASLRLENAEKADIVQVSQNVTVGPGYLQAGRTYRLRCDSKVGHSAQPNGISLAALTKELKSKGSWRIPFPAAGEWSSGGVEFTMPADADFLRIMINAKGPCRIWIDHVILEERTGDGWRPLLQPGLPAEHELIKQWIELFHGAGRPYLALGTMIHPPRLIEPLAANDPRPPFAPVMVNAYRAADGSEAAIIANATNSEQTVRFRWQQREQTLHMQPWTLQLVK